MRIVSVVNLGGPMTMPHFTSADLVTRYGHQQTLHFTYYLRQSRPSFAVFAFTVAHYRFDSHTLTRRFVISDVQFLKLMWILYSAVVLVYSQMIPVYLNLDPWLSGRTLVFDRRAFAVLHSTYS